jgi:tetratricopeptide (TPR) repeat protein
MVYALLACATFAVYLPAIELDFVNFDDTAYVTGNSHVSAGLTWRGIIWAFSNFHSSNWHPLTWISHMVDCQLYGLKPAGHHLTSVLFHIANSLLIFRLLKGMTAAVWRSAFVAGLFALHPLRVESVAWVAERKDVLSSFFGLLCLLAYVEYTRGKAETRNPKSDCNPNPEGRKEFSYYLLALLFFALGLMSKPMLVSWPFVMLLLDFWPLGRVSSLERRQGFRLLAEKVPFFALSAGSCVITFLAQRRGGAVASVQSVPWESRIENALLSYVRYIGKLFYPHDMAVVYPRVPAWPMEEVLLGGAALFVVTALAVGYWRRGYLATGWFWFLVTLVPVIGLIKVGDLSIADRYTYLPSVGVFIVFAWGIAELTSRWVGRPIPLAIGAAAILISCAVVAGRQVPYWQNPQSLFEHASAVTGKNALADINLGFYFSQNREWERAREHYQSAIAADPDFAEAWNGLGYVFFEEKKYDDAIAQCGTALQLKPDYADARNNLGNALFCVGKTNEAMEQFREAVRLKPQEAIGHYNLGYALFVCGDLVEAVEQCRIAARLNPGFVAAWQNLGGTLARQGQIDQAIACYAKAIEVESAYLPARQSRGELLLAQGKCAPAAEDFSAVLRRKPDDSNAHYHLALALTGQGRTREAMEHYRRGMRSFQELPVALNNLAWILATNPDPEVRNGVEAVALAEKACKLTDYKEPILMGTLAAAYAEGGRFADAIAAAEKARALAQAAQAPELVAKNAKLLELYRAGKPFRDVE